MDKYKLQQHIYDIGAELNTDIEFTYELSGMMFVEENPPRIEVPKKEIWNVWPEKCYVVSLHELGHVFHGHTQGRPPYQNKVHYFTNGVLKSEAEAWKFALDNTMIDWSDATKDFALNTCLLSYYRAAISAGGLSGQRLWNGNRHHYAFTYDITDDFFWNVAKELGYETV
jgi:hypothetical protein